MARVPYVDRKDLPEDQRHLPGSTSNITRAMSNSPYVAYHSGNVAKYIREVSKFDPRLREMAIIQVGYSARNAYEYTHHVKIGLASGVSEADVRAIADDTAGRPTSLDPVARTVLRAARELTDGWAVSAATFAELRKSFDNAMMVELIFAIATYTSVVRILASLEVDVEPEYEPYLKKFPLPA